MRVFGALIVQNEADVIEDVLEFLGELGLFEKLFFFDLGSDDGTFQAAMRHSNLLHDPQVIDEPYSNPLRARLLMQNRHLYREGDWLALVDADEFYAANPLDVIGRADSEGADSIHTFQADFFLTWKDLETPANQELPVYERLRHYLIDWTELRFFKYLPRREAGPIGSLRPCSEKLVIRHYRYRSPEQIRTRIRTRLANRKRSENLPGREPWVQVFSEDWRDYVVPHEKLHFDDGGPLQFGLPDGRSEDDFADQPFSQCALELALEHEQMLRLPPVQLMARDEEAPSAPSLTALGVGRARRGEPFNVQPDGHSAIWVRCENAQPGTVVFFNGNALKTEFCDPTLLTASIPPELLERPGTFLVWLVYAGLESNRAKFVVDP